MDVCLIHVWNMFQSLIAISAQLQQLLKMQYRVVAHSNSPAFSLCVELLKRSPCSDALLEILWVVGLPSQNRVDLRQNEGDLQGTHTPFFSEPLANAREEGLDNL